MEVLMHEIELICLDAIKPNPRNAHTHPKKQIRRLADNIGTFGFTVPVIIDENSMLLAGHCRFEAAKLSGLEQIPAIRLRGHPPLASFYPARCNSHRDRLDLRRACARPPA
jgi:ParB/Sulfiredoxin domain